jgi:hypothetical protein
MTAAPYEPSPIGGATITGLAGREQAVAGTTGHRGDLNDLTRGRQHVHRIAGVGGVAEPVDVAVLERQPVAETARRAREPDHRGRNVLITGRTAEVRVAEGEHASVARDEEVSVARGRRGHPDHRALRCVAPIDP